MGSPGAGMRIAHGGVGTTRPFAWSDRHQGHRPWSVSYDLPDVELTKIRREFSIRRFRRIVLNRHLPQGKTCRAEMRGGLLAIRFAPPASDAAICRRGSDAV